MKFLVRDSLDLVAAAGTIGSSMMSQDTIEVEVGRRLYRPREGQGRCRIEGDSRPSATGIHFDEHRQPNTKPCSNLIHGDDNPTIINDQADPNTLPNERRDALHLVRRDANRPGDVTKSRLGEKECLSCGRNGDPSIVPVDSHPGDFDTLGRLQVGTKVQPHRRHPAGHLLTIGLENRSLDDETGCGNRRQGLS